MLSDLDIWNVIIYRLETKMWQFLEGAVVLLVGILFGAAIAKTGNKDD